MVLVHPYSPSCQLIRMRGYHMLLLGDSVADPPLELVELSRIDAVLLSSPEATLALPMLTEYLGFRGLVVATAATLRLGEQLMLERVALHATDREHSIEDAVIGARPPPVAYSAHDCAACVAKVRAVSYGERVELGRGLHVVALPSGCGIGGALWSVQAAGERLVLASACAPPSAVLLASSGMPDVGAPEWLAIGACRPMQPVPAVCGADTVVLAGVRRHADHPAEALSRACSAACDACANGGNVLMPLMLCGGAFAIVEALAAELARRGLGGVPLCLVSPVAHACLTLANGLPEWLDPQREQRTRRADNAFAFEQLVAAGRLVCARQLAELDPAPRAPCVVIAASAALEAGDAPRLLRRWRAQPASLLLLTSPEHAHVSLAPFEPLAMRVMRCPIDARLGAAHASALLELISPRRVLWLPAHADAHTPPSAAATAAAVGGASDDDDAAAPSCTCASVERLELHKDATYSLKRRFVHARLPADAARAVALRPMARGARGSRVHATIHEVDRQLELRPRTATAATAATAPATAPATAEQGSGDAPKGAPTAAATALLGEPTAAALVTALRKRGLRAEVQHEGATTVVKVTTVEGARIELCEGESVIHLQHGTALGVSGLITEALREQLL